MKIAFIGPQSSGKTTLIENFLEKWPMYGRPEKTYRDLVKEKNLPLNKQGTAESQKEILNALVDEVQNAIGTGAEFLVFDRCVVDNIAYSLWHYAKGTEGFSTEFIIDSQHIANLTLKYYDIIFFVPAHSEIPLEQRDQREADESFRAEMDNIFRAIVASYEKRTGAIFPLEDCPAVISLEGPPDLRLAQIQLYLKENGRAYGEEESLIKDL